MAISKELIEAVENKDLLGIKLIIKNSLVLDPSGKAFSEMMNYVQEKIPEIFDNHNGEVFKDTNEWNRDYYNEQTVKIVNNFSRERGELLKKMAQKIFCNQDDLGENNKTVYKNDAVDEGPSQKERKEYNLSDTKIIGGCTALVGTGLLIGGLVIADAPVIVPIVGGLAIGVGAFLIVRNGF